VLSRATWIIAHAATGVAPLGAGLQLEHIRIRFLFRIRLVPVRNQQRPALSRQPGKVDKSLDAQHQPSKQFAVEDGQADRQTLGLKRVKQRQVNQEFPGQFLVGGRVVKPALGLQCGADLLTGHDVEHAEGGGGLGGIPARPGERLLHEGLEQ
jgi:hypothetical protein